METLLKQWPDNVKVFRIGKWRVDHFDQEMIRTVRKVADKRGSTVEEVIDRALLDFVEECVADSELATKIIPFPTKRRPNPNISRETKATDFLPPPGIRPSRQTMCKASSEK